MYLLVYFSNKTTEKIILSTCIRNNGKFYLGEHKINCSKFLYKEIGMNKIMENIVPFKKLSKKNFVKLNTQSEKYSPK